MKNIFSIIGFVFAILFAVAAYLQNNDPDAYLWYAIYGLAAVASAVFGIGRLPFLAAALLCVAYLVGGIISWPETFEGFEIGAGAIENIERGREACGLLIVSAVFLIYTLRLRYERGRF